DGEMDEPESLGSITLASRERLDNLIFVVNCNLQRLDGPVRGNGKIIQELEAIFRGAGWNVIKVVWGSDWDSLITNDRDGILVRRLGEITDGQYQKYFVESGAYFRQNLFGTDPRLLKMVEHLSDEQLSRMQLGGGYLPERKVRAKPIQPPAESHFEEFYKGTEGREVSTTMVFVRLLSKLLRDPEIGKLIVPIIPDEARTFGMEALFRQVGIY